MKTRIYAITSHSGESPTYLEGAVKPALSTLWKRFKLLYGLQYLGVGRVIAATAIQHNVNIEYAAFKRANDDGYKGASVPECFIAWLKDCHGYVETKAVYELYIGR